MGLMTKVLNVFGLERVEKTRAYVTPQVDFSDVGGVGRSTPQNYKSYLKQYTDAAWVFTCIQRIASQGAGVPLKLYKKTIKGDKIEATEIMTHPIINLLNKVNPFVTGVDLKEITLSYEELTGNAYWLLDMFEGGKPTEIYPLRPDRVKIVPDKKNYIKEYKYEIANNKYIALSPEQILHFRYFNSYDDYYGLSPLSAGRTAVNIQRLGDEYNQNFYANSAQPRGALVSEGAIKKENKQRIAAAWKQMHQGTRNAHKIAILEGGLSWQALGISQKDMEFISQKKMTREDIMGVFGVPPAMVGVFEFANYANSKEQREIFWRNTMVPKLNKYAAIVNEFLVKPWDESLEVEYDYSVIDALQADINTRASTDEVLTRSGIKTINEARAERGLGPVSWGDEWRAPMNLAPVGSSPVGGESAKEIEDVQEKEYKEQYLKAAEEKAQRYIVEQTLRDAEKVDLIKERVQEIIDHGESIIPDQLDDIMDDIKDEVAIEEDKKKKEIRDKKWYLYKDLTDVWEKKFIPVLQKEFKIQSNETLFNLEKHGLKRGPNDVIQKDADDELINRILFNKKNADKSLRKNGKPLIEGTLKANAEKEINALGLGISFDLQNPAVQEWIADKTFKFAHKVNKTTQDKLRRALKEAIKAGEGIPETKERINKVFTSISKEWSSVIARTEVISASNAGAMEAYKQSKVVTEKEWISSRDADVRPEHQIDGETVALDKTFSNGLMFPGDPMGDPGNIINCRCTQSGVVKI